MQKKSLNIQEVIRTYERKGAVLFLESQKKDHPASVVSYLALEPDSWIKSFGNEIHVFQKGELQVFTENPWTALQKFRLESNDWIFGYLGYDLKNYVEELDSRNPTHFSAPDMFFMVPSVLLEIGKDGNWKELKGSIELSNDGITNNKGFKIEQTIEFQKSEYLSSFKEAKRKITEGDFYEINYSYPMEFEFQGSTWALYSAMKEAGPVPFAAYLSFDEIQVCCSSPERFLAKKGTKVWTQPIKGTSPSLSKIEVEKNLLSEKNKAENLMIVDLVRNDLSRISKIGSVTVKDLFEIQNFDTVHQLVSTIQAEVEENKEPIEVIKACFPMGSMTGAPKISAMKGIEELENYKRGIYSGAIGYISPSNDFDFNVVIRSAIIQANTLIYPVGGAITSDSDLEDEWQETLVKAKALLNSFN